ncbi:MAG: hypothetical protein IJK24_08335 [Oscillospiraceae bacterium]|nr:hypothetical protein [Oscillospiraceae bacterium]
MADCKVVVAMMDSAASSFETLSGSAEKAGNAFVTAFNAAIGPMEGETKEALATFFKSKYEDLVVKDIPAAIKGLQELITSNKENFIKTDQALADSIPK